MFFKKVLLLIFVLNIKILWASPEAVYLTWQTDPNHTMTINWITTEEDSNNEVVYRQKNSLKWDMVNAKYKVLPLNNRYLIHRVTLQQLQAGAAYEFALNTDPNQVYSFKTMPEHFNETTRFIIGGDVYNKSLNELGGKDKLTYGMNKLAADFEPLCIFLGGDLAYAGHDERTFKYWIKWLHIWWESMRAKGNRLIPMVTAIGNHEISGGENLPLEELLYYNFFPTVNSDYKAYYSLAFGKDMLMIILDSGNVSAIENEQSKWLEETLSSYPNRPHLFVMYHHPAYPSVRPFDYDTGVKIRRNWVPIFEKYGIDIAFEHHDHAYKRTYPLYKGKINQDRGITFVGDGAWGVKPRPITNADREEFIKTQSARHFILLEIKNQNRKLSVIGDDGAIIDSWTMQAKYKKQHH